MWNAWRDFQAEMEERREMVSRCVTSKRMKTKWFLDWYWQAGVARSQVAHTASPSNPLTNTFYFFLSAPHTTTTSRFSEMDASEWMTMWMSLTSGV